MAAAHLFVVLRNFGGAEILPDDWLLRLPLFVTNPDSPRLRTSLIQEGIGTIAALAAAAIMALLEGPAIR